jgi:hypothetical protein
LRGPAPFNQFDSVLHRVSSILNDRPLTVRVHEDDQFVAISPNDILLGRCDRIDAREAEDFLEVDQEAVAHLDAQSAVVEAWWDRWTKEFWSLVVPRTKWQTEQRAIRVGDIACLAYSSKYSPPSYRLCRIKEVIPSKDGKVRTVKVQLGKKKAVGKQPGKRAAVLQVAVQRLAVIVPVEEQKETQNQAAMSSPSTESITTLPDSN